MPGCAAVGCNNRSEKGFVMKCFPRDPTLRKIWQERVARADWEPSNNSFLCHVHFEPNEWCILPNGRIRLKKNALPSIFTVTSTRKSPKKRGKLACFKNKINCEDDYSMEYLENDTEHSSIGLLEEKDSDSQDIDGTSLNSFIYQQVNHSPNTIENKQVFRKQYININNLKQENIFLISNDNIEAQDNIREYGNEVEVDNENKISVSNCTADENSTNTRNEIVKSEMKRENDQTLFDSYDEIEEKLKQICDGDHEESTSHKAEKRKSTSNNQKGASEKSVTQIPIMHRSINYKYSPKEIGSLLTDDTENIEIIFGSESGEECARVSKRTSYDNNQTSEFDKTDRCDANVSVTDSQEVGQDFSENVETALQGENIHVIPNMRAAIKRKRRTRKEIMKSLKKSMRNTFSQSTNSLSDSDISDNVVDEENEIKRELNASEDRRFKDDTVPVMTKFTVKVSGDREDIFDIMQDLSKDTKDFTIQECKDTCSRQGNNTFVTSVITIDDSLDDIFVKNEDLTPNITSVTSRDSDQVSFNLSTLKNEECSNARLMSPHFDEEKDFHVNSYSTQDVSIEQPTTNCIKYECQKLLQKMKVQEDVVKKLTKQLISYKNSEKDLQSKNVALEAKTKKLDESNAKTDSVASSMMHKKNMDVRQKFIDDLTKKVDYLEEVNKKLMKTITVEGQYKRKLEGQIKQKDNRIKELNWKLDKASKFLDRAEKNTITYRRKMLNMQTSMRRKKLLDEKMSKFNELLIDNAKNTYTNKIIAMALEIKEICGSRGYEKLLNFGFPLPSLLALTDASPFDNLSDSDESNNAVSPSKRKINEETDARRTNDETEANAKKQKLSGLISEENDATEDNAEETIMGTVQDIFEENNDLDDFSTNELREHFMLQLNAVI